MMRFWSFGRRSSSPKQEVTEKQEESEKEKVLENEKKEEQNISVEILNENREESEREIVEEPSVTSDTAHADTDAHEAFPAEAVEEFKIEQSVPEKEDPLKNVLISDNVPSEVLVSIMENIGQEALQTILSKEAEQASNVLSQLSIDLFENTLREDPDFPRDLDRIYTWFTDVLTDAERMTCAHVLLSTLTPNQLKFLFSSLSVDPDARAEVAYLDLAKSEASVKRDTFEPQPSPAMLDFSRFSSLEFKPEDGLFGNMNLSSTNSSLSSSRFESLCEKTKSSSPPVVEVAKPTPIPATASASEPCKPPGFDKVDHLSDLFNRFEKSSEASKEELKPLKLSVDAPEFRPIPNYPEMAYANIFYSDFLSWLRTLRLHKYGPVLLSHYEKSKAGLLRSSEDDLERMGVSALGARRKFKRLFEQILTERPPE